VKGGGWLLFGLLLNLVGLSVIYLSVLVMADEVVWWSIKMQKILDVVVAGVVLCTTGLSLIVLSLKN